MTGLNLVPCKQIVRIDDKNRICFSKKNLHLLEVVLGVKIEETVELQLEMLIDSKKKVIGLTKASADSALVIKVKLNKTGCRFTIPYTALIQMGIARGDISGKIFTIDIVRRNNKKVMIVKLNEPIPA